MISATRRLRPPAFPDSEIQVLRYSSMNMPYRLLIVVHDARREPEARPYGCRLSLGRWRASWVLAVAEEEELRAK